MQVTAPIYEKPSRLSQGLVVGLSIAVVAMAGWLAMTIMTPPPTTTSDNETDAAASAPVSAPVSPTEGSAAAGAARSLRPAARSVQFDWPEEFNSAPPPTPPTALPLAPAEVPVTRAPGGAVLWPAGAPVPDARDRSIPARQPASPAGNAAGTDAIVDLLVAPSVPAPRPAPARR